LTPEQLLAISIGAAIGIGSAFLMRRRFSWTIVIFTFFLLFADFAIWWVITPHRYDVTRWERFRDVVEPQWCLNADYFLVEQSGLPSVELAGFGSGVPTSVADYRAHPKDWMKSPEYQKIYGTLPFAPQPNILAVLPAGTPFRVVKVVAEYRSGTHEWHSRPHVMIAGRLADGWMLFFGRGFYLAPMKEVSRCP